MGLFYKPDDGWAADFIPFFWNGEYHLFYLKDYRDEHGHGLGTPWFHLGTRDFVNFTDYGEALPRGRPDEQDLYVFTGSAIERNGLFHIFYTGHNHILAEDGKPLQAVMHATSSDLVHWTKDPSGTFWADTSRYDMNDWRDPFVLWNEEAGEYWMLLAARLKGGPSNRRGCIALAASKDLANWEIRDPFWAPNLYFTHECPDLFRWGDWWYLIYSTFSERTVTHYRMSRSLSGPWIAPVNDTFDGRSFYAAKTAGNGKRRFAFGWNPTRLGNKDTGEWQWGGSLVVHELVQAPDGSLLVKVPHEVDKQFSKTANLSPRPKIGEWKISGRSVSVEAIGSFAWCRLAEMPEICRVTTTVTWSPGTRGCGVILRADKMLDRYYQIRLEPGTSRIVFDRWPRPGDQPFMLERPLDVSKGQPATISVFVEGSIVEVYVNDIIALSARAYDHPAGSVGLFVSEGQATFSNAKVSTL